VFLFCEGLFLCLGFFWRAWWLQREAVLSWWTKDTVGEQLQKQREMMEQQAAALERRPRKVYTAAQQASKHAKAEGCVLRAAGRHKQPTHRERVVEAAGCGGETDRVAVAWNRGRARGALRDGLSLLEARTRIFSAAAAKEAGNDRRVAAEVAEIESKGERLYEASVPSDPKIRSRVSHKFQRSDNFRDL
jgi:hypothetical protein